jgi:hypothetical protein
MRRTILALGLLGATLFTLVLLASFLNPLLIERAAREIVRIEIERRVGEKIDTLSNSKLTAFAQKALGKTDEEIEAARRALAQDVPRKVANVVADMLNANCECRRRLVGYATKGQEERLSSLSHVRENLVSLIESAYSTVTTNLMRELRIVTASNAVAFALLSLVAYFRRGASLQLLIPAVVLVGAVAITASLYLFNQNWLHTIIYSQYVGWGYVAYLGAVAALLADVLINRARITTKVVNAFFQAVGLTLTAIPC